MGRCSDVGALAISLVSSSSPLLEFLLPTSPLALGSVLHTRELLGSKLLLSRGIAQVEVLGIHIAKSLRASHCGWNIIIVGN